jgi:hypothetical protein
MGTSAWFVKISSIDSLDVRTHPHAEAIYDVVRLDGGGFGVKVSIPDTNPTTVSSFDNEAAAEAWIALHKSRVRAHTQPGTIFRRSRPTAAG